MHVDAAIDDRALLSSHWPWHRCIRLTVTLASRR